MQTLTKIQLLLGRLDSGLVERELHTRLSLLALLSGHHVLLLGPPGTAKSLLARALCNCIAKAAYFEYLLSKFTHPDELFGPVSIPGLKEEDYRRLTEGYLPTAHVAFLDEIFKANSAILNSLLTLINERVFHHGKHRDRVPLLGMIGASNEPPDPEGGLDALYDRFLVRIGVPAIAGDDHFVQVALGEVNIEGVPDAERLTTDEIMELRRAAAAVSAGPEVRRALIGIRKGLLDEGIKASDRRWRWAAELLKMAALTSGRDTVVLVDLLHLEHCFGDPGESDQVVRTIVRAQMRAQAAMFDHRAALDQTWQRMRESVPPMQAPAALATVGRAGAYAAARQALQRELDLFDHTFQQTSDSLDRDLHSLRTQVSSCPWISDIPPELLAGFIDTRRALNRFARASDSFRRALGDGPSERLLAALRAEKRDRQHWNYYQRPHAVIWIGKEGSDSSTWVPLDEEGNSLFENQSDCIEQVHYAARKYLRQGYGTQIPWQQLVLFVPISDNDLFAMDHALDESDVERSASSAMARAYVGHAAAQRKAVLSELHGSAPILPFIEEERTAAASLAALLRRPLASTVCTLPAPPTIDEPAAEDLAAAAQASQPAAAPDGWFTSSDQDVL